LGYIFDTTVEIGSDNVKLGILLNVIGAIFLIQTIIYYLVAIDFSDPFFAWGNLAGRVSAIALVFWLAHKRIENVKRKQNRYKEHSKESK